MRKTKRNSLIFTLIVVGFLFLSGCMTLLPEEEMHTPATPQPVEAAPVEPVAVEPVIVEPVKQEKTYTVGERGPAGGYVVYDKDEYSDGWRYLEAAPEGWSGSQIDPKSQWGAYTFQLEGAVLKDGIGDGLENSRIIVDYNKRIQADRETYDALPSNQKVLDAKHDGSVAAALCVDASIGGYHDWYLPSKDELLIMRESLYQNGKGSFQADTYWSSSLRNERSGAMVYFTNGSVGSSYTYTPRYVRPIRRF